MRAAVCRQPVQPPVSCACPWLEGADADSDYRKHQFQARAFHWQRAGKHHDGRICLFAGMQLVDTVCTRASLLPYPDFLRHIEVLNRLGAQFKDSQQQHTGAAHVNNTIGFDSGLRAAFVSDMHVGFGRIAASFQPAARSSQALHSTSTTLVSNVTSAFLEMLDEAAALPVLQTGQAHNRQYTVTSSKLPVMYFGAAGSSPGGWRLALTHYLHPFWKVCWLCMMSALHAATA